MKILICGASGLLGGEIMTALFSKGYEVVSLHRGTAKEYPYWDIKKQIIDLGSHTNIDVVINLAGENIAQGRWTKQKKEAIFQSRVESTKLLSEFFSKTSYKPKLIISGSAIGYYGNRYDEELDENSTKGSGFLADVCDAWEDATKRASDVGIRVVHIRVGMVLSAKGGALAKMIPPFKLGLGGRVGDGKQYISWISIEDVAESIIHIINTKNIHAQVNLVSPEPVTNDQFTKILGKALHRMVIFPLPAFVAKIVFGEMAEALLLASTKVKPMKLLDSGYEFKHSTLDSALSAIFKLKTKL